MDTNDTRSKLKNIIDGVIIEVAADNCTATRNILCASFSTSTTVKRDFESKAITKKEQVEFLIALPVIFSYWAGTQNRRITGLKNGN
ncbi:hypothetical protein GCM10022209_06920 [Chitinophaga oryziterrae]